MTWRRLGTAPLSALLVLSACDAGNVDPGPGVFRGIYRRSHEIRDFQPEGSGQRWWVIGEVGRLDEILTDHEAGNVGGTALAVVDGDLSERGSFGHLSAYRRQLTVRRFVKTEAVCLGSGDTCPPPLALRKKLEILLPFGFFLFWIGLHLLGVFRTAWVIRTGWGEMLWRTESRQAIQGMSMVMLLAGVLFFLFLLGQLADGTFRFRGERTAYGFSDLLR